MSGMEEGRGRGVGSEGVSEADIELMRRQREAAEWIGRWRARRTLQTIAKVTELKVR